MIAYTRSRAVRTVFTLLVTAAFLCLPGAIASGQEKQPTTKPDKPVEFKQLQKDFRQAYRAADYPKALASLEKMNEQKPKDIDTLYNLACVTCLLGQKDKTYGWIEKAIEAGYKDWRHLSTDNDLRTIHAEDRFRKIVKELRAAKLELPPEEKPAKPETPKKPEKPEKPEKPAKPETPKKPEKPAEPEKPAKPKEAEKPAKKELSAAERQGRRPSGERRSPGYGTSAHIGPGTR